MVFSKYTEQGSCHLSGCQLCLVVIMCVSNSITWIGSVKDEVKSISDLALSSGVISVVIHEHNFIQN